MARTGQETVYVAVGKDIEASKPTLSWALDNFPGRKLGVLHVHQPAKMLPSSFGGGIPQVIKLGEHELKAYQELDRQIMNKILDNYLGICHQAGVATEKLHIEKDDIRSGIVELICGHKIKQLVMGAAAGKYYSEGMTEIKSIKAMYVCLHSPMSCQIWFTCKGNLIRAKYAKQMTFPDVIIGRDNILAGGSSMSLLSTETEQFCQMRSPQRRADDHDHVLELLALPRPGEPNLPVSLAMVPASTSASDTQAGLVSKTPRREACKDIVKQSRAEQSDTKAMCKIEVFESLYKEECRHRVKIEEELAREKECIKTLKKEWEQERLILADDKVLLEAQVQSLNHNMKELESAEEMSRIYSKDRDDLWVELEKVKEELMKQGKYFSYFSLPEIQEATNNFDPSFMIGEGGYGTVYKGLLCRTSVAVKVLDGDGRQGPEEFEREVDVLSKLRHPNVITLIGVCPEALALIYEYLPNGSLEDRLNCQDNSQPLSWKNRIRIAAELCSALIFMHSRSPEGEVHGDLNPANILLDANLACKLSDFGICPTSASRNIAPTETTELRGIFNYMNPHYLETGKLSPKSITYSFGTILLQLLTGKSSILEEIQEIEAAIDEGNLMSVLDTSAGDLPFVQAEQLAHLALRCCNRNPDQRPNLDPEVWKVLDSIRSFFGSSSHSQGSPEASSNPPSYFICPITQEVMENPTVAADGFTYEEEQLRGWLDSGKDTSPMTNLRLEHTNLVPNHALRSAIQEWRQRN